MKFLIALMLFTMTDQPRQVLLFYKEDGKEIHDAQIAELNKSKSGMKERDLTVKSFLFTANSADFKKWDVDTSKSFTFILVGKDGGEKHRSNTIVKYPDLFGKIDAMPMRKSEVKK